MIRYRLACRTLQQLADMHSLDPCDGFCGYPVRVLPFGNAPNVSHHRLTSVQHV